MKTYAVAVRTLCDFAAKQGDLDLRFTPSPTAQQGIAGHQAVAARRGASRLSEVNLSGEYKTLRVRGRADGYHPEKQHLEEVKTFRGDLDRMPANHRLLHWAQAEVYGALVCRQLGLPQITLSLIYFDVDRQEEAPPLARSYLATELQARFEALCERFIAWAEAEMQHRKARDAALLSLQFPYGEFRAGQRDLAKAVFNAARSGRCLMAQAPTGIGKTMASLFPMLKACPGQAIDKVFFLTAKGSGRALAWRALDALRSARPGLPLRVVELVAREKSCEHPDKLCHGDSCPLARGFYDRLPKAREEAAALGALSRESLRDVARRHAVCPYYLGQEMARWSDVVVGDYNHFYDGTALLHGLTVAHDWKVGVLVDEAHNLVDRGRAMYTASLSSETLRGVRRYAPTSVKKPLDRLKRHGRRLLDAATGEYTVFDEPPRAWVAALQDVSHAISDHLAEQAEAVAPELLAFYFETLAFARLLESFGRHSIYDLSRMDGDAFSLCVRNVWPAPFLKRSHAVAHATVLFSATLAPVRFYADVLGLPEDTASIDVPAPFHAEQLTVHLARDVSTRYAHRSRSLAPIARRIVDQYTAMPGNYIAFFSSFDYLEQAALELAKRHPAIPLWQQTRRMSDTERDAFLARFTEGGRGIGFAVLGGSFGEGIDLPGSRLVGAFVATLGFPQFNAVNEEMRRRLDAEFGSGHDYTYLFPGLRKVVQAAGRVIRTPTDRGTIHLIDDRYARPEVLRLLPAWWNIEADDPGEIV